jgi:phthiocerol/phenolphthiocerol synthesis type-I polyketide synthase E
MSSETAVAVVGVGCRFPDAWTPEELWSNLERGLVSTRELPEDSLRSAGVPDGLLQAPDYVRVAATLPDVDRFAAGFFGYSPAEAELIDPQQRIFLEACWEALESAGHPPHDGGSQVAVFAGASFSTYTTLLYLARARAAGALTAMGDVDLYLGGVTDFLASRVAYRLGLRGPSVGVQTACSSSLTAVHCAVLSLLAGECDIALAGGTGLEAPQVGYCYQPGGLLSEDGYCRAFDIRSTGTAKGAGVGAVALRRLADALADGDPILAVVRGTAAGNDGSERPGFTAPSPAGVAAVVSAALRVAEVPAEQLCYVEAHGSGTPLGDHVELVGLVEGLRATTSRTGYCGIGSVKVNIGHAESAAGIAGLIKAVQVARTGRLPPHPLFERPRDHGLLAESPFHVPTTVEACADPERHVLVNSMGLGGTNAAVVLAPPPAPVRRPAPERGVVRLLLSGRSRRELDEASRRLAEELERKRAAVADVAHTLRVGRPDFAERRVVTGPPEQLAAALRLPRPPAARTARAGRSRPLVVLAGPAGRFGPLPSLLAAALRGEAEVTETMPDPVPVDRFLLLVGTGEPGPNRHLLRVEPGASRGELAEPLEEALCAAWLHGVTVDWEALAGGAGRRVRLPTYPFERRSYWALEAAPLRTPAPDGRAAGAATTPAGPVAAARANGGPAGQLEAALLALWRELFGVEAVGLDDEFGALGGTSLLATRMALEIQRRHGTLLNLHRIGGSKATVRRIAAVIRARAEAGSPHATLEERAQVADGDVALVDADLELPLGALGPARRERGRDVLLTGATGFLGAFLLHELLARTAGAVWCLVRAEDAERGWERLREAARRFRLPDPEPRRVRVVPGDLREAEAVCARHCGGELGRRVGHVVHAAARVVFTEPYRVLRTDNVLATAGLLRWMRASRVDDLTFVSSLAACGRSLGAPGTLLERREQPLEPEAGGYGVSKWVCEQLLERAERDGMRVRVFRPGLVLGSTATGACNAKDLVWRILASGLAVGAHPLDHRPLQAAPVDVVARAIVELAAEPGAVGRAFHVVDEAPVSPCGLFDLLAEGGLPTSGLPLGDWHRLVAERALATGDPVPSSLALYELERRQRDEVRADCARWREWLGRHGLGAGVDGPTLRRSLEYLVEQPEYRGCLAGPMEVEEVS